MRDYFIDLFNYNGWANTQCCESVINTPSADDKAVQLLSHIISSQTIWLSRISNKGDNPVPVWGKYSPVECRSLSDQSTLDWISFIESFPDEKFSQSITYRNSRNEQYTNSIRNILTHVVNHSTYHRGQIAALVRTADGLPAITDYIFYKRD